VRLVFDLSGQDRLPIFRLHVHTFEGRGVPVAEFASHHNAVECLCTLAHHLSILVAMSHTLIRGSYKHVRSSLMPNYFREPCNSEARRIYLPRTLGCAVFSLLCFCIIDTIGT